YVRAVCEELSRRGIPTEVFTRRSSADGPERVRLAEKSWVTRLRVGPPEDVDKGRLFDLLPRFTDAVLTEQGRRRSGYSLVHSHYWLSGWVAARLRDEWKLPWFHTFHTLARVKNERAAEGAVVEPEHRIAVEQAIVRNADRLIASSLQEADDLVRLYSASRQRVSVVAPGVDLRLFAPRPTDALRMRLGLGDAPVVVFAGRVGGVPTIVKDGLTGFTLVSHDPAQYAERIGRLLSDGELRRCFSRRSRLVATQFSWTDTVDRLVAEYTVPRLPELRPAVAG